jgi:hypothetical protein
MAELNIESVNDNFKRLRRHAVTEWLRQYATSRKVEGSRPDEVNEFFFQFT